MSAPFDEPQGRWDLSCLDWAERLRTGRSLIPEHLPVDIDRKMRAVGVYDRLRIPDIPGTPMFAQAAGQWQRDIVGTAHGSIIGGDRMIREGFVLIPKKQAKTTMGAGMALTEFILNERPMAEFLLVAATQAVANLAFRQIQGMIKGDTYLGGSPGVKGRMKVAAHVKTVTDTFTDSVLHIRSFDANVLTGVKPTFTLLDELHLMSEINGAADIIGQIRGGMISQAEALLVFITTQSFRPPAGVFLTELRKARNIRDGLDKDTRMLPVLYEFPDSITKAKVERGLEPWRDPSIWHMVTPNAGKSITIPRLIEEYEVAVKSGEEEVRRWASQHLNIQIGLALRSDRWEGADHWEKNGVEKTLTIEDLVKRCDLIVGGIDGGGLDDLLGACLLGREIGTGTWLAWVRAWVHRGMLDARPSEAGRMRDFELEGSLIIVEELADAYRDLAKNFAIAHKGNRLGQIGIDPLGIGLILEELKNAEISEKFAVTGPDGKPDVIDRVVGISQGYRLQMPIKTAAVRLSGRNLLHQGLTLMDYCVGNAKVVPAGNAILITKQVSGSGKIDPLMALFDAVALMAMDPAALRSSYEDHELRFIESF